MRDDRWPGRTCCWLAGGIPPPIDPARGGRTFVPAAELLAGAAPTTGRISSGSSNGFCAATKVCGWGGPAVTAALAVLMPTCGITGGGADEELPAFAFVTLHGLPTREAGCWLVEIWAVTAGSSNGLPLAFAEPAFVVIFKVGMGDLLTGDAADGLSLWVFIVYMLRKDTNAIIYVLQAIRICLACNGCCLEVRVQMDFGAKRSSPDMDERIRFQEWSCQARASRMFFGYKSM